MGAVENSGDRAEGPQGVPHSSIPGELLLQVYQELKRRAAVLLRAERQGHTLSTTALVHEAYLKLCHREWTVNDRRTFYFAAAEAMVQLLKDYARGRSRLKRGGGRARVTLEHVEAAAPTVDLDLRLDADAVLQVLARMKADFPRQHQVIMLRYFAGRTIEEVAELLSVSPGTVKGDWTAAIVWMRAEMTST